MPFLGCRRILKSLRLCRVEQFILVHDILQLEVDASVVFVEQLDVLLRWWYTRISPFLSQLRRLFYWLSQDVIVLGAGVWEALEVARISLEEDISAREVLLIVSKEPIDLFYHEFLPLDFA